MGRLGRAPQARQQIVGLRAVKKLGDKGLEGDTSIDYRIKALIHDPHAATSDLAADLVLAELLRQRSWRGVHAMRLSCVN